MNVFLKTAAGIAEVESPANTATHATKSSHRQIQPIAALHPLPEPHRMPRLLMPMRKRASAANTLRTLQLQIRLRRPACKTVPNQTCTKNNSITSATHASSLPFLALQQTAAFSVHHCHWNAGAVSACLFRRHRAVEQRRALTRSPAT